MNLKKILLYYVDTGRCMLCDREVGRITKHLREEHGINLLDMVRWL